MATVKHLARVPVVRESKHSDVECTYFVSQDDAGKYLQIDTYGSQHRKIKGKKSQSLRFASGAIAELKQILSKEI
jgi:hypothetical protein